MATIKDVAKEAGVSVATVSRVINKSPKASKSAIDAVSIAMRKLGYRPNANARALVSQSTNTLGVLVGDVSDPFFGSMVKSIDGVARNNGKHILIGNGYHDADTERDAIELLINSRCESLVIHSKGLSNEELIAYAKEVPGLVLINRYIPEIAEKCIALDNHKGSYLATEYLIRHGHQHIGYVCSNHQIEDAEQRKAGYQEALKAHGLHQPESYIEYGSPDEQGGEQAMTNLLAKNLPITAIAAYNDYMAAGSLSILEENGIQAPENMSLIGFDDGLIAKYLHPKLTTIRYPIQMMAEHAAQLSLKLANKNQPIEPEKVDTDTHMFMPTLVRRLSVDKVKS
ncbi:DNA-binding transcriptional regulator GalS [Photobacterium frigidiphilum]|uniref:DNA-binding transcriptional regulator GalS n=1 Tax=Photobacterium frigidiphilum TaxID=264736 RepID=A0A2T3J7K7_9GAMM|nr:substrate-binding domain-containing protein [Photobacterium frigidiphilum]PSU44696.1 DNA-binding transcriptional regulator GalS [Photobacterium frigidiphilum]